MAQPAETKRQYFNRRHAALKAERSSFDYDWKDVGDYILPLSSRFFTSDRQNRKGRRNAKIINDTATHAASTLSGGLMSGKTSPARPWFQLRTSDPDVNNLKPVKVWLDLVRQRMSDVFQQSNLYQALPIAYKELGVFGTTAFALMPDDDTVIRAYPAPLGSYCIGTSSRGVVDTFVREFQMTIRQMVQQFGEDALSTSTLASWKNGHAEDVWLDVVHFVEPNPDYDPASPAAKAKPFRSVYYEKGSTEEKMLSESGFDEFPIMASRWEVTGEDVYGSMCPGFQALGDIKGLQIGEKRGFEALDKVIRPPMTGPSSLRNKESSTLPNGMTWVDVNQGQQGFVPTYQIQPDFAALDGRIARMEQRINRAFYVDMFLLISSMDQSQPITAAEVAVRKEEKMLMLGPVLERMDDDMFDPLIKRTFNEMDRRGMIPPPPPEMGGTTLVVEYVSILSQAQKLVGVVALEKLTNYIMSIMQAFPSAGDKFGVDEAIEQYAEMVGAGPKIVRDAKEAAQIRQAQAQKQQAAEAMAAMQQGAETVKSLGQTPVTDDTALGAMMARMGAA